MQSKISSQNFVKIGCKITTYHFGNKSLHVNSVRKKIVQVILLNFQSNLGHMDKLESI